MTPQTIARRAGLLYLISGVPAGFSVWVTLKLVVRGDSMATAANILGSEALFRAGLVADLIGIMVFLASVLLLERLFQPVSRSLPRLMTWFALVGAAIQALDAMCDMAALLLLKGGPAMAGLDMEQARPLAYLCLRLHTLHYDVALMFYGGFGCLIGFLIWKSAFLPRALGVLMAIDGLGYLTFGCVTLLAPILAAHAYPVLPFLTAALGEASLMLWLIVKAVDAPKWEAQAAAAMRPTAAA